MLRSKLQNIRYPPSRVLKQRQEFLRKLSFCNAIPNQIRDARR
jgi:hypothetical protein